MVSFLDFYSKPEFCFSLEVFPPKTSKGIEKLFSELQKIRSLKPSFVSVTYGAMGSTRNLTEDLAIQIHKKLDVPTAFHFTCVGAGREEIKKYVEHLASQGIHLVVALRGDLPAGETNFKAPENGFRYANELVDYLNSIQKFSIAVAGYPEKHTEAQSFEDDLKNLKRKVDSGADIILTQLFYDNAHFYNFRNKAEQLGIRAPIVPGILPIRDLKQIERITKMSGASLPESLYQKLKAHQDDPVSVQKIGEEFAIQQCLDLVKNNVPGIHFYCLNRADSVVNIVKACQNL